METKELKENVRELSVAEKLDALVRKTWLYKKRKLTVTGYKIMHAVKVVVFTREDYTVLGTASAIDDLIAQFTIVPEVLKVPIVPIVPKTEPTPIINALPDQATKPNEEMPILETRDYDRFSTILGNRTLNKNKIDKIAKDVREGLNMLPYYPVIVSEKEGKLMVIDGQHRLEVSKKTGNPVYYLMCETLDLKQIAQLNSRGEKWKPQDFLNCYINLGIQDYVKLRGVVNQYRIGIKAALTMLMYENVTAKTGDEFQTGNFKCNHFDETIQLLDLVVDLFNKFDFVMDRNLIKAVQVIKAKGVCDFERLKIKIQASGKMDRMSEYKKYLSLLNEIYNHGNQKMVHIF